MPLRVSGLLLELFELRSNLISFEQRPAVLSEQPIDEPSLSRYHEPRQQAA
jgi:hypothetical protein